MNSLDLIVQYSLSFIGKPYLFGGDDPILGFDCSGFVQELLVSSGVMSCLLPKQNAQMVYNFLKSSTGGAITDSAKPGSIVFFGKDEESIVHVGFCISPFFMVEAGGGDYTTINDNAASKRNAFIKIRPIKYRKDYLCIIEPLYHGRGM